MKLLVSDYNQLEFWISNQLNRLNNDNPEVLAKLVISLVKQDREQSTLDSYYEEQLKTFLKDKTKSFVLSLLSAIKDRSYEDELVDYDEDQDEEDNNNDNSYDRGSKYRDRYSDEEDNRDDDRNDNNHRHQSTSDEQYSSVREKDTEVTEKVEIKNNSRREINPHRHSNSSRGVDGNFGKSMYNNIRHSNDKGKFQGKNNRGDHNRKNSSERRQSGGYNQNQHTHQYEQYQLSFLPEFPPPEHGVMLANYKEAPPGWGPWMEELHFPIGQGPYPYDQPPMYSWPGQPNDSYNLGNYHNHSLNDCGYLENPEFVPPIVYPSIPGPEISRESQHYNAPIYPINNGGYALLQAAANEAAQVKVSETSGKASSYNDSSRSRNRFLPDDRRFTLRCTGIPSYVSKEDIMKHFEAFGSIVELHYNLTKRDDTENKKAYNECLVQFYHLENAKKCYNSPLPVLNNRFIKLFQASTNLINIAEVTASSEIIAKDKALLAETVHQLQHTNKHQTEAPSDKVSKNERSYTDDGPPGKYMRVDGGGVTNDGNRRATELPSADGVNILKSPEEFKEIPVPPKPTEEDLEMKRQFEDLKELRNKADKILKDKEAILQKQLEKFGKMIDVLEMQPETESNRSLLQNLESKVMNIQSQLRSVKEKLEKGIVVPKNSSGFSPPLRGLVTASHGGRFSGRVSLFGRGYRGRTPGRGGRTFGRGSEENRPVGQSTEQTELQSTILNPGIAQEMISDVAIVEETTNQTGQVN